MPYSDRYIELLYEKYKEFCSDIPLTMREVIQKLIEFHDEDRAVGWNTTCRGCADLLDKLYELEASQEDCCPNVGQGKYSFQDIKDQQLFVDTVGDDLL